MSIDTNTGRWTSWDSTGYRDGLDTYVPFEDDPVDRVDPLGFSSDNGMNSNLSELLGPHVIGVYGPGKQNAPLAELSRLANFLNEGLKAHPTGSDTLREIKNQRVHVFITEKMSVWDRKRTPGWAFLGLWPTDYIEEADLGIYGEGYTWVRNGRPQKQVYLKLSGYADMANTLVHETVHTHQRVIDEVEAWAKQTQWNIEIGQLDFTGDLRPNPRPWIVPDPSTASGWGVDKSAIQDYIQNSPIYNWTDQQAKGLYEYKLFQSYVPGMEGEKMDFDPGSWVAELGGFCPA